ncbi:MAG: SpoIIE family protein phosphatase [Spirochaetota bacterium]
MKKKLGRDGGYKNRFEYLFKYSSDPVVIVNENAQVVRANDKALLMFGSNIQGEEIENIFESIDQYLEHSDGFAIVQSANMEGKLQKGNSHSFTVTIIPITVERTREEWLIMARDLQHLESYRQEIEKLNRKINTFENRGMEQDENSSIHLEVALKKLEMTNQKLEEINKKLIKELELAAVLQKSLVPSGVPEQQYLDFAFHYEPMGMVGGDYYDVIELPENKKGVLVADVSGHGVSSAFIAAMLKISFNNFAAEVDSPAKVLDQINQEYCRVIQTGDYVTAFYAVFDPVNKKVTYSGAGHPRPLVFHKRKNQLDFLSSEGFFLGMFEGAEYTDKTTDFLGGDRYLIYTDGIIEAYSEQQNRQFGTKRLVTSFDKHKNQNINSMLECIIGDVKDFMCKSKFYDDLAMVAVEFREGE